MEPEISSSSDVPSDLKRLLKEKYPDESLLQSLLEEDVIGVVPLDISIDGISLKIEEGETKASIDQKLETFFMALEKKSREKEAEKGKDREIKELKEKVRYMVEQIKDHERRKIELEQEIKNFRFQLDLARAQTPPNQIPIAPASPFPTPPPSRSSKPIQKYYYPESHVSKLRIDPEYTEAIDIFDTELLPLYRAFALRYNCSKKLTRIDINKYIWVLKKVAAVLDTQKGASPERDLARQAIAQEKSLKQKMRLIADFIKKFM